MHFDHSWVFNFLEGKKIFVATLNILVSIQIFFFFTLNNLINDLNFTIVACEIRQANTSANKKVASIHTIAYKHNSNIYLSNENKQKTIFFHLPSVS